MVSGSSNFRHPIINTFLWLFGDSSTSKNTKQIKGNNIGGSSSSAGDSSSSVGGNNINPDKIAISCGKVSWRDSKDGDNLAIIYGNENTNRKQHPYNNNNNNISRSHSSDIDQDFDNFDGDNFDIDGNPYGCEDEVSESPQWGFYVSLSPNHQEIFPRASPSKAIK